MERTMNKFSFNIWNNLWRPAPRNPIFYCCLIFVLIIPLEVASAHDVHEISDFIVKLTVSERLKMNELPVQIVWDADGDRYAVATGLELSGHPRVTIFQKTAAENSAKIATYDTDLCCHFSMAFGPRSNTILLSAAHLDDNHFPVALYELDINTGRKVRSLPGYYPEESEKSNSAASIVIHPPSGLLALVTQHDTSRPIILYDYKGFSVIDLVDLSGEIPQIITLSPDGKFLAVGMSGGKLALFDANRHIMLWKINAYAQRSVTFHGIAFSHAGDRLAVSIQSARGVVSLAPDGTYKSWIPEESVKIFRTVDGALTTKYGAEYDIIADISWAPNDKFLAGLVDYRSLFIWHSETGTIAARPLNFEGQALHLSFRPRNWEIGVTAGEAVEIVQIDIDSSK
jgi:WD40 repeat protein